MNRRQFCKIMFGAAIALAIPTIPVIPESKGNVWIKPEEVAAEALNHLEDALRFVEFSKVTTSDIETI